MKKLLYIFSLLVAANNLSAQQVISIWPQGKMPNSKGLHLPDSIDKGYLFTTTDPKMYFYPALEEKNTGAAVLIVPGGGYLRLPADYSKNATALYYQSKGINVFVLCHRLPGSRDLVNPEKAPLQDAQRAMRIIRANANSWGIDPDRIGVGGTSAGGHVASTLGTHTEDLSAIGDSLDQYSFKPAFMMLVSAVISFKNEIAHKGSRTSLIGNDPADEMIQYYSNENRVTKETPPALLIHGNDDRTVPSLNSVVFYQALRSAGVSASLHIFPSGGHGYTVNMKSGAASLWPGIAIEWLKEMKFIQ
ncbi:MAG: alpha/beta hydrolase [Niabella sp.]